MNCGGVEVLLVVIDVLATIGRVEILELLLSVVQDVTCTSSIGGGVQAHSRNHLAAATWRLRLEVLPCLSFDVVVVVEDHPSAFRYR